jgi:CheY-like chemotaxis protein
VELHGGRVHGASPGKGGGAIFTVTLPIAGARGHARGSEDSDPRSHSARLRGVRALVVDDDADFLDLAATMLREAGAEVRTAPSVVRATELLNSSWQPSVVLTDIAMPGEDGYMLLQAMRSAFSRRGVNVPIIAISAYGAQEDGARATRAGFDVYLAKPVDPVQLTSVVAEVTSRLA